MPKATGPRYRVPFRRRREGKTNYKKRLALVKSQKPRLVVRPTNKRIIAHLVRFEPNGDKTLLMLDSNALKAFGWPARPNTPTAYLLGVLLAKKAKQKGINDFVLDIGISTPSKGNIRFAVALGAVAGGLQSKVPEDVVPKERIRGEHIAAYYSSLDAKERKRRFSYDASKLPELFDEVLTKIGGENVGESTSG